MEQTIEISEIGLIASYLLVIIPVILFFHFKIPLISKTVTSIVRMSLQLLLVGIYLKYVFLINSLWLNILWITIMVVVANFNITANLGMKKRPLFPVTLLGLSFSTAFTTSVFLLLIVKPTPVYDARYLIPIAGMILGNCLRGNIIGLERFFSNVQSSQQIYLSRLFMGATIREAVHPFLVNAVTAALLPTISSMATLGIVSLPGMMTGQILGGSTPLTAIRYQIAIMLAIFSSTCIGVSVNLLLAIQVVFDDYGILKRKYSDQ